MHAPPIVHKRQQFTWVPLAEPADGACGTEQQDGGPRRASRGQSHPPVSSRLAAAIAGPRDIEFPLWGGIEFSPRLRLALACQKIGRKRQSRDQCSVAWCSSRGRPRTSEVAGPAGGRPQASEAAGPCWPVSRNSRATCIIGVTCEVGHRPQH